MEVSHVLPQILDESILWKYFFNVLDTLVGKPLTERVDYLKNRYNLDWLAPVDREVIQAPTIQGDPNKIELVKRLAQYLGYHYKNLQTDPDTFMRFASESIRLGPSAGTKLCFNFIQYIINGYMEVRQLYYDPWAQDFAEENDPNIVGRRIVIDGETVNQNCYPTNYVSVYVEQSTGLTTADLLDLLYSAIPNNLVIKSIITVYVAPVEYSPDTVIGQVHDSEQAEIILF